MTKRMKIAVLLASTTVATLAIGATAAQAAEVDMTCKVDIAKNTIRCGNLTVLNITSKQSTVFGAEAAAFGDFGTAVGYNAEATGYESTAVGATSKAHSWGTAIGSAANASAAGTVAVGTSSLASAVQSTAVGNHAEASGNDGSAFGNYSVAKAGGTAIGAGAEAYGGKATALGFESYTIGLEAVAVGYLSNGKGTYSTALGSNSFAEAEATALGHGAKANAYGTIAIGKSASSLSELGIAIGLSSNAYAARGISLGYKAGSGEDGVAIGTEAHGSSGGIAVGWKASSSESAVAVGSKAYAYEGASAFGTGSFASGPGALALGGGSQATGEFAAAIGYAKASGNYSMALGDGANAAFLSSVALGRNAITTADGQLALGGLNSHVRIGDVASSTAAQDGGTVNLATVDANGVMGRSQVSLSQLLGGFGGGSIFDPKYLEDGLATHDVRIGALETKDLQLQSNISIVWDSLDTRVKTLEQAGSIGGLAFDPTYLENAIAQYGNRLDAIETLNGEQSGLIKGLSTASVDHEGRIVQLEAKVQNLGQGGGGAYDDSAILTKNAEQDTRLADAEAKNVEQDERLGQVESKNGEQDIRLAKVETKNDEQDTKLANHEVRLTKVEDVVNIQKGMNAQLATMQSTLDSHGAAIGTLQGQVSNLFDLAKQNRQGIREANGGVAMALAMESPAVPAGKTFAISGGVGNFKGQTSLSMALSVAVGEAATVSAGVGYSVNQKDVGTRAGFQIAF